MTENASEYQIRLALPSDALQITTLYHRVYRGTYTDSLMRDGEKLIAFLRKPANAWVVAERGSEIVGSVAWETDERNRMAKVFGGAVLSQHRGTNLLERAMRFGADHLAKEAGLVDVIYATTRTATQAPQLITERLGYKKLGIFPNVHRTDSYETHCLAAFFCGDALARRFTDFHLHPKFAGLFELVQRETGIGSLPIAAKEEYEVDSISASEVPELEIIEAPLFALHRFEQRRQDKQIPFHFYPFHTPNTLIASPCQQVEIYVYLSPADQYCTLVGIRKPNEIHFANVLLKISELLRRRGVRYIETIARSDRLRTVDGILKAGFVPCAYFPAFQLSDEGLRYDYVVLSKTFEILDFRDLKLAGSNRDFLQEYYRNWRDIFLGPLLMDLNTKGERPRGNRE